MKKYEDLTEADKMLYEGMIEKEIKRLEGKNILKKEDHSDRLLWSTCVDLRKLTAVVGSALSEKHKTPGVLMINGQKVLLSLLPFLIFVKGDNQDAIDALEEEYLVARQKLLKL